MRIIKAIVVILSIFLFSVANAQKLEKVEQVCKGLAFENRLPVAVPKFSNSVRGQDAGRFQPEGLTDMLVNALQNTGCYMVLERKDMNELMKEQDFSNSNRADATTSIGLGKLKGAGILVIGNVTEFSENADGIGLGGVFDKVAGGIGGARAHLGMIIKLIDTKTGAIINSKSFERKVTKLGLLGGAVIGKVPVGAGGWKSKAMQDAAEELIIQVVQYISKTKEGLLQNEAVANVAGRIHDIQLTVKDVSYDQLQKIASYLSADTSIKQLSKSFENRVGTMRLQTIFSSDAIADLLTKCKCDFFLSVYLLNDKSIGVEVNKVNRQAALAGANEEK